MPQDRRAWLLAIGRRLRAEYDAVAQPVPERLLALVEKLEQPVDVQLEPGGATKNPEPVRLPPAPAQVPPLRDPDTLVSHPAAVPLLA